MMNDGTRMATYDKIPPAPSEGEVSNTGRTPLQPPTAAIPNGTASRKPTNLTVSWIRLTQAWVNLIQLTVKFVGFLLAVPFGIAAVGGWSGVRPVLETSPSLGAGGILSYVAILVPSFIISPGLIQKLYGARSA